MPKFCMVNKLKPEYVAEYSDMHRNCWSEMRQALIDSGAKNCTVFVNGNTSILFYECDDLDESFEKLGQNEDNNRWQAAVAHCFDNDGGFAVTTVERVFDLFE